MRKLKRISVEQVRKMFVKAGIPGKVIRAPDRLYVLPSPTYMTGRFLRSLQIYLRRYKILNYQPGLNDCDDFARHACAYAAIHHARSYLREKPKGYPPAIAVAEIWYTDAKIGGHATFLVLVGDGEIMRFDRVVELRKGRKTTLIQEWPITRKELRSCYYCRLG